MKHRSGTKASKGAQYLRRTRDLALVRVLVATMVIPSPFAMPVAVAQSLSAQPADNTGGNLSPAQLTQLVAQIALYPDPLLAIVLPASTEAAEIVQAQQFLNQHATDPSAKPSATWDPSVVSLLNYPDVIRMMNNDLAWTQQLGDAVTAEQQGVMGAIQRFRQQAYAAGNLTSNDKVQVVTVQNGASATSTATTPAVIQIQSANPTVLYVPQYNPVTIVRRAPAGYPPPYAYSTPYPAYISPAAPFFTGAVFGAAVGFGLSWASGSILSGALGGGGNVTNVNINNINNHFNTFEHNGANMWHPASNGFINPNNHGFPPNNFANGGGNRLYNPPNGGGNESPPQTPNSQPNGAANRFSGGGSPPNGGGNGSPPQTPNSQPNGAANRFSGGGSPPNGGGNGSPPQTPNNQPNGAANRFSGGGSPPNGGGNGSPPQTPNSQPNGASNRFSGDGNPPNRGENGRQPQTANNEPNAAGNRSSAGGNPPNNGESRSGNQASGGENRPNANGAGERPMANAGPRGGMRDGGAFSGVDQPRSQAERAQARGNASLRRANSGPRRGSRPPGGVHPVSERRR